MSEIVWFKQAKRDLVVAEKLFNGNEYYAVAFFCQQAAEKSLKALYIKRYNELLRVHDLVKIAKEVKAPKEVLEACTKINPVYIEVRYPESDEFPADKVNRVKAEMLINLVKEILKWVKTEI